MAMRRFRPALNILGDRFIESPEQGERALAELMQAMRDIDYLCYPEGHPKLPRAALTKAALGMLYSRIYAETHNLGACSIIGEPPAMLNALARAFVEEHL